MAVNVIKYMNVDKGMVGFPDFAFVDIDSKKRHKSD
jgi:hypothetical protein